LPTPLLDLVLQRFGLALEFVTIHQLQSSAGLRINISATGHRG